MARSGSQRLTEFGLVNCGKCVSAWQLGARQHALGQLLPDVGDGSIGKRSHVQGKGFRIRIEMVPSHRGEIAIIAAVRASPAGLPEQFALPSQATGALSDVVLMAEVGIRILAAQRAEPALASGQRRSAGRTCRSWCHALDHNPFGTAGCDPRSLLRSSCRAHSSMVRAEDSSTR